MNPKRPKRGHCGSHPWRALPLRPVGGWPPPISQGAGSRVHDSATQARHLHARFVRSPCGPKNTLETSSMTAPAIDLSQAVRVPRRNAVRAAALTALKLVLGAAGLAGVAAGAIWLVTDPAPPSFQSAVRLVKVGAWPEIKDGVPALAASTPAPAPTSRAP